MEIKPFFVDFKLSKNGMYLTSYVAARDEHHANRAIRKAYPSSSDWIPYPIDEIPCDCSYLDEEGNLKSAGTKLFTDF